MYLYDNLFTTSIAIVDVLTNVVSVASLIGVQILRTFGILLHLLECRKFLTLHRPLAYLCDKLPYAYAIGRVTVLF